MAIDWTFWPSDPTWSSDSYWGGGQAPWIRPARPGTMRWTATRTVEPVVEPIDLAAAKNHLRVDIGDDDNLILNSMRAARDYVEIMTGLVMATQTWALYLDRWPRLDRFETWPAAAPPGTILLPRRPIQSITSVRWFGSDGSTNTVTSTDYVVDLFSQRPRITPASSKTWPTGTLVPQNGVVVTFVAGYADLTLIPSTARQLQLLMLGHFYQNREAVFVGPRASALEVPLAAKTLLGLHQPNLVG